MSLPDVSRLHEVCDATWPAAARREVEGWIVRTGAGGGKRVSAATIAPGVPNGTLPDIARAERAMRALGQVPLFMVRQGEDALDEALQARGYGLCDPVRLYACPVSLLSAKPVARMSAFVIWPPLAIQRDIWASGGIGAARVAVMERAAVPRTSVLARARDRAAGTAYVGIERKIAMLHAIEVVPEQRRQGVGLNILRAAAHWAQENGARHLSLIVTDANVAANGLYLKAGMTVVGKYHYRVRQ